MPNNCDVSTSFVICKGTETCEYKVSCVPKQCVHAVKVGTVRFCNSTKAAKEAFQYESAGDCHNCSHRPFNKHKSPCYDCETDENVFTHWSKES